MAYSSNFYVSVLITVDDNVVVFKKPVSNGHTNDYCWVPVYKRLHPDQSPKDGAMQAIESHTGLKLNMQDLELFTVQSKPTEEYKCWMFTITIPPRLIQKIKTSEYEYMITPVQDVPHPQNWILNAYLEPHI